MAALTQHVHFTARFFLAVAILSGTLSNALSAPPTIVSQPASQTAAVGTTARLTVVAAGSDPLNFQWLKNSSAMPNATSATLTIANVQISDAAIYTVRVSNDEGSILSDAVSLAVVSTGLLIKTQPASQTVKLGAAAVSFRIEATSALPVQYQWLKDGTVVPGATNATLTLTNIRSHHAGNYAAVVYNAAGAQQSDRAILTVDTSVAPLIIQQPAATEVRLAQSAMFDIVAEGQSPLRFQWLRNGSPIQKATNNVLILESVQSADAANYSVTISNSLGRVTSTAARLTVQIPPTIKTQPTGKAAASGSSVTLSVVADGSAPLRYQWVKDTQSVPGATNAIFVISKVKNSDNGVYQVQVQNAFGSILSSNAVLIIGDAPSITAQPAGLAVNAGADVQFSANAAGTPPLRLQWLRNGSPLANQTNVVLTLTQVQSTHAGTYTMSVSNAFGKATTTSAVLKVDPAVVIQMPPVTTVVPRGLTARMSVVAQGLPPLVYQWSKNGSPLAGATNPDLLIPNVEASDAGNYSVTVTNAFGKATSGNVALRVEPSVIIQTHPQNQTNAPGIFTALSVGAIGLSPLKYEWFRNGVSLSRGTNDILYFVPLQITDAGNYHVVVGNPFGSVTSKVAAITVNAPPLIVRQPITIFTATGRKVQFDPETAGSTPLRFQWLKNNSILAGATNASLTFSNAVEFDSGAYHFVVTNRFGATTSSVAHLNVGTPPTITRHPTSRSIDLGADVLLSAQATGTPPLNFQWRKNGLPIDGAFLPAIELRNVQHPDAGKYHVVVSNPYGTAASVEASVSIRSPPIVLTQPRSSRVETGGAVRFSVTASGSLPLNYQWLKDERPISGATNSELILTNAGPLDAGSYRVRISNPDGEAFSTAVLLTVDTPPDPRGDFDGDGQPDLIFQHSNGSLGLWSMNKIELNSAAFLAPSEPGTGWRAIDSADFDRDGREDLLLQREDGILKLWFMEGLVRRSEFILPPFFIPAGPWKAIAAADLNQDQHADILLQNSASTLSVLLMNSSNAISSAVLNHDPVDSLWQASGLGDFSGDGQLDLLFQHEDGTLAIWELKGTFIQSAYLLDPHHPGDSRWRAVGTVDRNGDAAPDILFQHSSERTLGIWFMNRTKLNEAHLLIPHDPGPGWNAVGP